MERWEEVSNGCAPVEIVTLDEAKKNEKANLPNQPKPGFTSGYVRDVA